METIAIERSIWINAPRERVWQAITDPQQVEQWFAPGTTFKTSGEGADAKLYVEDAETGEEMFVQVMKIFDPPNHLEMHSQPEPPETPFITSYKLETENSGTRLTLIYSGYEGLPDDMRQQLMDENATGFELMLGNIKAFIEGTSLPNPGGF